MPTTLFDDRYELDLGGTEVHMIHVGPCHEVGDTIVHVPKEEVVFAGDIIFHESTPMGWVGTYDSFFKALDLIISLNPKAIVPGPGPICGVEGVTETKEYFQYVRTESRKCFYDGMSSLDAAKKIDFGRDCLIFATPVSFVRQFTGRILRPSEDKQPPVIVDIVDVSVPKLRVMAGSRAQEYKSLRARIHLPNGQKIS